MTTMQRVGRGQGMVETSSLGVATRTGEREDNTVSVGLSGYCCCPWNSFVQMTSRVTDPECPASMYWGDLPSSQTPVMIVLALT